MRGTADFDSLASAVGLANLWSSNGVNDDDDVLPGGGRGRGEEK